MRVVIKRNDIDVSKIGMGLAVQVVLLTMLAGCDNDRPRTTPSYCPEVRSILERHCTRCHSAAVQGPERWRAPGRINLDTYDEAVEFARRTKWRVRDETMPPGGGMPADEIASVIAWVEGGTPNGCADSGSSGDSNRESNRGTPRDGHVEPGVTYCRQIRPLLERGCTSCHASSLTGAARRRATVGVDYDSYEAAVANIARGNTRIQAGTMPPGIGFSSSERALFSAWVAEGTPECSATNTNHTQPGTNGAPRRLIAP